MSHSRSSGTVESVHLVGSVPLESAAAVFRTVSVCLGGHLRRIPDGETGERLGFVGCQVPLLAGHPHLELVDTGSDNAEDPRADLLRVSRGEGTVRPIFRLRHGADRHELRFPPPGYAAAALASYAAFARLKTAGEVSPHLRFQVSLPTPLTVMAAFIDPAQVLAVLPAYESALMGELVSILEGIPADELAIQWDVAGEIAVLERVIPVPFVNIGWLVTALVELGAKVPRDVELGYHFCYGDLGRRHFIEPADLRIPVGLANRISAQLTSYARPLDWVHMPVPRDRHDDEYFAPLAELRIDTATELYLGLIHLTDGVAGAQRRIRVARDVRPSFGVATECGFGRRDPATLPRLFELHRALLDRGQPPFLSRM